jgi:hypothetical protein
MATGTQLNNLGVCGNANLVGYNAQKGCPYNFKNTIELWRTPADFEFDDSVEFDADYIKSLQLAGNLSIIKGITDFPENGTDPLIETLPDNTEISAGDAKYKYSPVFASADLWFNKLLGYIEGQGNNRFIFVDSAGNMLMTQGSEEGKSRGFLTSRTARAKFTLQSPGVGQKATLDFQLANTYELQDNFVFRNSEALSFDPRLIEAVIQSTIDYTAVPSDTDTTITVVARVSRGLEEFVTGATNTADWKVTVNGVDNPVTLVAEALNVYTLTVTAVATDDVVNVSFNDVIEIVGDGLYRSFRATTTVVA